MESSAGNKPARSPMLLADSRRRADAASDPERRLQALVRAQSWSLGILSNTAHDYASPAIESVRQPEPEARWAL